MKSKKDDHHNYSNSRPAVGVGVMLKKGNSVLLGRRKGAHGEGSYGWPGGGLAFSESLSDAVKREAFEEAGINVLSMELICVSNIIEYGRHYIDFEFMVTEFEGDPENKEEFSSNWVWYDLDELPSPLFKPCELAINSIRTGQLLNDK